MARSKAREKTVKAATKLRRRPVPPVMNRLLDASKIEKELIFRGTVRDRIDTLTLLVERNPSPENYKSLLSYVENQRNDVIYHALKNIRDLLVSKKGVADPYIKQRIVKSFEINMKNKYIKKKVVDLVHSLLHTGILFLELIHCFVDKIGDKKELSAYVVQKLQPLFPCHEEILLDSLEDFYFKNDHFRARHAALELMAGLECSNRGKMFQIFDAILSGFHKNIPEEQRNILLEDVIMGLGKNITNEKITRIELIREATYTEKTILYGLRVLTVVDDPEAVSFLAQALRSNKMRDSQRLPDFLNTIDELGRKRGRNEFYRELIDTSFLYTHQYVVAVLVICAEARGKRLSGLSEFYGLRLLCLHWHPVVRKLALQLIRGETVYPIDPFDRVALCSAEMMCAAQP
jgi:hypothetical protein